MCMCVCVFFCVCYNRSHRSHLSENKKCKKLRLQILTFVIEWRNCKIVLRDLDLLFESEDLNVNISEKVTGSAKMCGKHL